MTDRLFAFAVNAVLLVAFFSVFATAIVGISAAVMGLVGLATHYDAVLTYIQSHLAV